MIFSRNRKGLLGQNERNLLIQRLNPKKSRVFADSKLQTKEFFLSRGVAVPGPLAVVRTLKALQAFDISTITPPFVIKPNGGAGGKGILVIEERDANGAYVDISGEYYSVDDLMHHMHEIITGYFSISGSRDSVIIEEKVILDSRIALLGAMWLPDLRIIVYNLIPIMAMMRIPTEASRGKANIHQWACAAGIDMGDGTITSMLVKGQHVHSIPGMGDIRGVTIPGWNRVLELASYAQKYSGINYLACDIALDSQKWPVLLELNVRPGLEVQNANRAALGARIKKVADIRVDSVDKGVRLGKDLFGRNLDTKIRTVSGMPVLGVKEYIHFSLDEKHYRNTVHIDPNINNNYIAQSAFEALREKHPYMTVRDEDGEQMISLNYQLLGVDIYADFVVRSSGDPVFVAIDTDTGGKPQCILGKKHLHNFLVHPHKYWPDEFPEDITREGSLEHENKEIVSNQRKQILTVDEKLVGIDRKLKMLVQIQPTNVAQEQEMFIQKEGNHVPKFTYRPFAHDLDELEATLDKVHLPDVPLKEIYELKKQELFWKIDLLRALSSGNDKRVSHMSEKIFWWFYDDILQESYEKIENMQVPSATWDHLTHEEISASISKFCHIYGIELKIIFTPELTSRCAIGRKAIRIRSDIRVSNKELRAIVAHEIEGHYLRRFNAGLQDFEIFSLGTARYVETEEGLAIYNQHRFLSQDTSKYYTMYRLYATMDYARNHSFKELVMYLSSIFGGDLVRVFQAIVRMKRGLHDAGGAYVFHKDLVYLNGYTDVSAFLERGWQLKDLYIGKIHTSDVGRIMQSGLKMNTQDLKYPLFVL